ncbi:Lrp/AsnC family transcriptional regulator [Candidatus Woesearchaeota archaeon]|nr:Lrp/AsnC family transcriptional regulator [Candidatus Woesearchaeota archaeon]
MDILDKKIITLLDSDARQSASEIGKQLSVAKETVNFRIKRLLQANVIKGFYPLLDTSKLHRFFFKIFIKFKEMPPERRKEILDFCASYPKMSQVLLLEGKYDVQLFFFAEENKELLFFMEALNKVCGIEIREKQVLIVDTIYRFPLQFLIESKDETMYAVQTKKEKYVVDEITWNVLRELSKNARAQLLDIAKSLQISPQVAQYHLRKAIKEKLLISSHVAINYEKLHVQHYHVTFQLNDLSVLKKIIEFFRSSKKSIFATTMIGCYDGSAEVLVENNEELRKMIDELLTLFSEKITTLDVFLIYKEYELRLYPF